MSSDSEAFRNPGSTGDLTKRAPHGHSGGGQGATERQFAGQRSSPYAHVILRLPGTLTVSGSSPPSTSPTRQFDPKDATDAIYVSPVVLKYTSVNGAELQDHATHNLDVLLTTLRWGQNARSYTSEGSSLNEFAYGVNIVTELGRSNLAFGLAIESLLLTMAMQGLDQGERELQMARFNRDPTQLLTLLLPKKNQQEGFSSVGELEGVLDGLQKRFDGIIEHDPVLNKAFKHIKLQYHVTDDDQYQLLLDIQHNVEEAPTVIKKLQHQRLRALYLTASNTVIQAFMNYWIAWAAASLVLENGLTDPAATFFPDASPTESSLINFGLSSLPAFSLPAVLSAIRLRNYIKEHYNPQSELFKLFDWLCFVRWEPKFDTKFSRIVGGFFVGLFNYTRQFLGFIGFVIASPALFGLWVRHHFKKNGHQSALWKSFDNLFFRREPVDLPKINIRIFNSIETNDAIDTAISFFKVPLSPDQIAKLKEAILKQHIPIKQAITTVLGDDSNPIKSELTTALRTIFDKKIHRQTTLWEGKKDFHKELLFSYDPIEDKWWARRKSELTGKTKKTEVPRYDLVWLRLKHIHQHPDYTDPDSHYRQDFETELAELCVAQGLWSVPKRSWDDRLLNGLKEFFVDFLFGYMVGGLLLLAVSPILLGLELAHRIDKHVDEETETLSLAEKNEAESKGSSPTPAAQKEALPYISGHTRFVARIGPAWKWFHWLFFHRPKLNTESLIINFLVELFFNLPRHAIGTGLLIGSAGLAFAFYILKDVALVTWWLVKQPARVGLSIAKELGIIKNKDIDLPLTVEEQWQKKIKDNQRNPSNPRIRVEQSEPYKPGAATAWLFKCLFYRFNRSEHPVLRVLMYLPHTIGFGLLLLLSPAWLGHMMSQKILRAFNWKEGNVLERTLESIFAFSFDTSRGLGLLAGLGNMILNILRFTLVVIPGGIAYGLYLFCHGCVWLGETVAPYFPTNAGRAFKEDFEKYMGWSEQPQPAATAQSTAESSSSSTVNEAPPELNIFAEAWKGWGYIWFAPWEPTKNWKRFLAFFWNQIRYVLGLALYTIPTIAGFLVCKIVQHLFIEPIRFCWEKIKQALKKSPATAENSPHEGTPLLSMNKTDKKESASSSEHASLPDAQTTLDVQTNQQLVKVLRQSHILQKWEQILDGLKIPLPETLRGHTPTPKPLASPSGGHELFSPSLYKIVEGKEEEEGHYSPDSSSDSGPDTPSTNQTEKEPKRKEKPFISGWTTAWVFFTFLVSAILLFQLSAWTYTDFFSTVLKLSLAAATLGLAVIVVATFDAYQKTKEWRHKERAQLAVEMEHLKNQEVVNNYLAILQHDEYITRLKERAKALVSLLRQNEQEAEFTELPDMAASDYDLSGTPDDPRISEGRKKAMSIQTGVWLARMWIVGAGWLPGVGNWLGAYWLPSLVVVLGIASAPLVGWAAAGLIVGVCLAMGILNYCMSLYKRRAAAETDKRRNYLNNSHFCLEVRKREALYYEKVVNDLETAATAANINFSGLPPLPAPPSSPKPADAKGNDSRRAVEDGSSSEGDIPIPNRVAPRISSPHPKHGASFHVSDAESDGERSEEEKKAISLNVNSPAGVTAALIDPTTSPIPRQSSLVSSTGQQGDANLAPIHQKELANQQLGKSFEHSNPSDTSSSGSNLRLFPGQNNVNGKGAQAAAPNTNTSLHISGFEKQRPHLHDSSPSPAAKK